MAFGVTAQGFVIKRGSDIQDELEAAYQAIFGAGINLQPGSNFSQLIGIQMSREAALWELAQDVYNATKKDTSEGVNLDNALALVAVPRLGQIASVQQGLLLFGTAGALIPAGTKVYPIGNPQSIFQTQADITLVAGNNEVQHIAFGNVPTSGGWVLQFNNEVTGTLAFNITASALQTALNLLPELVGVTVTGNFTAGFDITFAGAAGLINQPLISVNSNSLVLSATPTTITITTTTAGTPQGVVDAVCSVIGPIPAPAYTLTGITTPVTGLTGVLNIVDAVVGQSSESDPAYRLRANIAQASSGRGTLEAMRSKLLALTGVTNVTIFENTTSSVDGNSLPAHTFRCYVQGGASADILNCIWQNKPTGIASDGSNSGVITDSQGLSHTVKYSVPTQVPIYVSLTLTTDSTKFPTNGDSLVRTAVAAYINALGIGQTVITFPALIASINGISGILGVTLLVDTNPAFPLASNANIAIGVNQIAVVVDPSTDITVSP